MWSEPNTALELVQRGAKKGRDAKRGIDQEAARKRQRDKKACLVKLY